MLNLIKSFPALLLFGIFQIFFSAPGQTFLIALYVPHIFADCDMSMSAFAGLYSGATLLASLLLNPAGRLLDRYRVNTIVLFATIGMSLGCFLLSYATGALSIFMAFFVLRLIGQGVFGLSATTTIIKNFQLNRGSALAIIMLGFPLSEAIYPGVALALIDLYGWRLSYVYFGLSNLFVMLPLQWGLIKKSGIVQGEFLPGETGINPMRMPGQPEKRQIRPHNDFPLGKVLKDLKFYFLLAGSCLPPLVVTGLFFHQDSLFVAHQWPISLAVGGFGVYAFTKAIGSLVIGPVVDRHGPLYPFVLIIVLLGLGTLMAAQMDPQYAVYLYFAVIGAALGFSSPVMNVVWPYFYGTKYIGSIKGFIATFRNGLTALGPLPIAMALDRGYSIQWILTVSAVGILILSVLPMIAFRLDRS